MTAVRVNLIAVIIGVAIGQTCAQNVSTPVTPTPVSPTPVACGPTECDTSELTEGLSFIPIRTCYTNGIAVEVTCNGNIGGPDTNTCNNGSWLLPIATCEVFTCARPTTGETLNVSPDKQTYVARESITYSCSQGYVQNGAVTATCDAQDLWNPPSVPICTVSCDPPVIENGGLESNDPFAEGDVTEVKCNSGYTLASGASSLIMCSAGGWSDIPKCFASCNISGIANSDRDVFTTFAHEETLTVECLSGFSYNEQTMFTLECEGGVVGGMLPDKCYADCPPLTAPGNGSVSGGYLHGQTAYYSCNRGFLLNGTDSVACYNGSWSDYDTPVCEDQSVEDSITLFCETDKFVLEVPGVLLGDNPTLESVALGTCIGSYYDGEYLYANSSYTDCGTTIEVDSTDETVIYRNTLVSVDTSIVTTEAYLEISTMCVFDQNNIVSSTAIINVPIIKDLDEASQYDISFRVFTDSGFTWEVTENTLVDTNTDIFLLAEVNYVTRVDVFPTRCYATPQPEFNYHLYEDLILEGCPNTTLVDSIARDATLKPSLTFRATVFRFTRDATDRIYIHCDLKICPLNNCPLPTTCANPRRGRRSTDVTFSRRVSTGPIRMPSEEPVAEEVSPWQFTALTVYSALISTVMIGAVALMGVRKFRGPSTKSVA